MNMHVNVKSWSPTCRWASLYDSQQALFVIKRQDAVCLLHAYTCTCILAAHTYTHMCTHIYIQVLVLHFDRVRLASPTTIAVPASLRHSPRLVGWLWWTWLQTTVYQRPASDSHTALHVLLCFTYCLSFFCVLLIWYGNWQYHVILVMCPGRTASRIYMYNMQTDRLSTIILVMCLGKNSSM